MRTLKLIANFFGLILALATVDLLAADAGKELDLYRPQFHFTPPKNWMNDPNGLVFFKGEYHLFYQHNPFGNKWGHMSWGHAVSRDMAHWEHLPLALAEEDGVMIFSGSAVVDWKNTSGLGKDGEPPLVAIYTGHRPADNREMQCVAYSNDKGRTWTKFAGNPVLDFQWKDFRDPKVHWNEAAGRWVMTVAKADQRKIRFYGSENLTTWSLLSEFGPAGATGGVWECPDLFELPVEGSHEKRWVLIVNVGSGAVAGGSGGQYFVGQFDGTTFTPESKEALWLDYGKDFYASVTWSDLPKSDGRRILLGWMANSHYAGDTPTSPWRSALSLPRELGLRKTEQGIRLTQRPIQELSKLREGGWKLRSGTVESANELLQKHGISGAGWEMEVEFQGPATEERGLKLFKGPEDETVIAMGGFTSVDRRHSGLTKFHRDFAGVQSAPPKQNAAWRVIVDACSIEVFASDGTAVITDLVFPLAEDRGVEFFGAGQKISRLEVWKLKSALTEGK